MKSITHRASRQVKNMMSNSAVCEWQGSGRVKSAACATSALLRVFQESTSHSVKISNRTVESFNSKQTRLSPFPCLLIHQGVSKPPPLQTYITPPDTHHEQRPPSLKAHIPEAKCPNNRPPPKKKTTVRFGLIDSMWNKRKNKTNLNVGKGEDYPLIRTAKDTSFSSGVEIAQVEGAWGFSGQQRELLERKGLSMDVFFIVPRSNKFSRLSPYWVGFWGQESGLSWEFLNAAEVP